MTTIYEKHKMHADAMEAITAPILLIGLLAKDLPLERRTEHASGFMNKILSVTHVLLGETLIADIPDEEKVKLLKQSYDKSSEMITLMGESLGLFEHVEKWARKEGLL